MFSFKAQNPKISTALKIRSRREITFLSAGFLLLLVLIWYLWSHLSFLVDGFNAAFNLDISENSARGAFDLNDAARLLNK